MSDTFNPFGVATCAGALCMCAGASLIVQGSDRLASTPAPRPTHATLGLLGACMFCAGACMLYNFD